MKNKHLTQSERDRIEALLNSGHKQKEIAEILKRPPCTISREVKRNRRKIRKKGGTVNGKYEAGVADQKAYIRRKYSKFQGKKIEGNKELREYIIDGLKKKWSPDEISGRMEEEKQSFYGSKNLIYEWLYSSRAQQYCQYLYSERYRVKKRKKNKTKRTIIPNKKGIEMRPEVVKNNTEYGHCEADTIVSGKKTGSKVALAVSYERKAKFTSIRKISSMRPCEFNKAMVSIKDTFKDLKTWTMDNGIENIKYEKLGVPTYFCNPYHSWEKPGVENANKMIRWFVPKGCDINNFSDEKIKNIENIINSKPRKSLNYKTPLEVALANNLLK
jgi:IS30 family transposase